MNITFEFATQDDCLDKMVPSDLRKIVSDRDYFKNGMAELQDIIDKLQPEITDLQRRNDELVAQVEFWKDTAEDCATIGTTVESCHRFEAALKVSPPQCLAKIKSEAGRAGFVAGYSKGWNDFDDAPGFRREPLADQYAAKIAGGE